MTSYHHRSLLTWSALLKIRILSVGAGVRDSLEWLSLQGCPALSSRGLESLRASRKLSYLDLSGTSVVSLHCLSKCTSLQRLRLSGCEQLADGAMHCLTGLPALCDLDLRGSKHLITATLLDDLAHISGACHHLPER